jgi:NTE family protein
MRIASGITPQERQTCLLIIPPLAVSSGLTAFVFAGGGSLGAIEVGMLRELLDWGVRPDCVIGASAGAINAAYFAGRPDAEGVAMLELLWCRIRRRDIMPLSMFGLFEMMLSRRSHLVEASGAAPPAGKQFAL